MTILNVKYTTTYDVVFVAHSSAKNWILEKICKVIASNTGLRSSIVFSHKNGKLNFKLPSSRAYFFAHFSIAYWTIKNTPNLRNSKLFFWFTHPNFNKNFTLAQFSELINWSDKIFCTNSKLKDFVDIISEDEKKSHCIFGGFDKSFFDCRRGASSILLVSGFYERKNPNEIIEVIKHLKNRSFIMAAPHPDEINNTGILWQNSPYWDELKELKNLQIISVKNENLPLIYQKCKWFLSLSVLEGGPIPLLEAMAAGLIPMATNTGFAEDIIKHSENGYILDKSKSLKNQIGEVLNKEDIAVDVIKLSVKDYSWENFGRKIANIVEQTIFPETIEFGEDKLTSDLIFEKNWWFSELNQAYQTFNSGSLTYFITQSSKICIFLKYRGNRSILKVEINGDEAELRYDNEILKYYYDQPISGWTYIEVSKDFKNLKFNLPIDINEPIIIEKLFLYDDHNKP